MNLQGPRPTYLPTNIVILVGGMFVIEYSRVLEYPQQLVICMIGGGCHKKSPGVIPANQSPASISCHSVRPRHFTRSLPVGGALTSLSPDSFECLSSWCLVGFCSEQYCIAIRPHQHIGTHHRTLFATCQSRDPLQSRTRWRDCSYDAFHAIGTQRILFF